MTAPFSAFLELGVARNAFAAVGVGAVLIWPHVRRFRVALVVQCVGAAGLSTYFALGGSTTAAASCAIAMVQLIVSALVGDRRWLYAIYLTSLILLGLCVAANWEGWPSALIGTGTILATYARMQSSASRMKKWFLVGSPFWLTHNIITANYFALLIDALSIVSGGWSVLEEDRNLSVFTWPKEHAVASYA